MVAERDLPMALVGVSSCIVVLLREDCGMLKSCGESNVELAVDVEMEI